MEFGEAIRAIKERVSLVDIARRYVELRPNGARFAAPCPFHQETKPSFFVSPDKGLFYCFGCQASGDLIDFYARVNGLDFRETVAQLADEAGIIIDRESGPRRDGERKALRTEKQLMLAMHRDAALHFAAALAGPCGAECQAYIRRRGLTPQLVERFELGFAARDWQSLQSRLSGLGYPLELAASAGLQGRSESGRYYDRFRGRLIFPIKNLSNQIIAFGGRIIADEEEAKYINSSDTPIYSKKEHLYGLVQARRSIAAKGCAILTEGYMDVLTLHQFGFENSVGVLGTALTEEQIRRLSGFTSKVDLLFDGDRAGRKAALRSCELLLCRGLSCRVVLLPDGEDIDSLLRKAGVDVFEKLLAAAPDGLGFCIDTLRTLAPREAIGWARNFLAKMRVKELVSPYASQLAQSLGIAEREFRAGLPLSGFEQGGSRAIELSRKLCERDTQIMLFAVRYPERLEDLRELGADLALSSPRSRQFWDLIEHYGPEEVIYHLDDRQRQFWLDQRGPLAPPRLDGDGELQCLKEGLNKFYAQTHAASLARAMAEGSDGNNFDLDLEYLRALRDAMRNKDEQS